MNTTLPEGITQDMVDAAKAKHKTVKLADLYNADDNDFLTTVLVGSPDAQSINQFERFLDREPGKAKKILVKATLCSQIEINQLATDNILFVAAFSAAAEMLPAGKAVLKNL